MEVVLHQRSFFRFLLNFLNFVVCAAILFRPNIAENSSFREIGLLLLFFHFFHFLWFVCPERLLDIVLVLSGVNLVTDFLLFFSFYGFLNDFRNAVTGVVDFIDLLLNVGEVSFQVINSILSLPDYNLIYFFLIFFDLKLHFGDLLNNFFLLFSFFVYLFPHSFNLYLQS